MNDRRRLRSVFNKIDNDKDKYNVHLKDYLITICPQRTEKTKSIFYPFSDERTFKKKVSIINAIVNRRFLKRNYMKRPEQKIVFYNFIENSLNKNLIHTHSLFRIPRILIHKLKEIFDYLISVVRNKFEFSIRIDHRPDVAIRYMTKKFSENNDRYFVC